MTLEFLISEQFSLKVTPRTRIFEDLMFNFNFSDFLTMDLTILDGMLLLTFLPFNKTFGLYPFFKALC